MRKVLSAFLLLNLIFLLHACGGGGSSGSHNSSPQTSSGSSSPSSSSGGGCIGGEGGQISGGNVAAQGGQGGQGEHSDGFCLPGFNGGVMSNGADVTLTSCNSHPSSSSNCGAITACRNNSQYWYQSTSGQRWYCNGYSWDWDIVTTMCASTVQAVHSQCW